MGSNKIKGFPIIEILKKGKKNLFNFFLYNDKNNLEIDGLYMFKITYLTKEIHSLIEECSGSTPRFFPEDKIEYFIKKIKDIYGLKEVYFIYNWEYENCEYTLSDLLDKVIIEDQFTVNLREFSNSILSLDNELNFKKMKWKK